jgi:hypothetical protein
VGSLRGRITAVGLVLAVASGLIGGILLQQYVNFDTVQRRLQRQRARAAYDARRSDPKQWASIRHAGRRQSDGGETTAGRERSRGNRRPRIAR